MDQPELLSVSKKLLAKVKGLKKKAGARKESQPWVGPKAEVMEFLKTYAGPKSSFYMAAKDAAGTESWGLGMLVSILTSFLEYVETGLHADISPTRQAQLDVVSDFLSQAQALLDERGVHPAAPCMLIGATLEEFLRNWCESIPLSIGNRKEGIQAYADVLREADILSKQEIKDITAWSGNRNHAAHGEWDEVSDPQRIKLMLEGVNLFMKKRGA